MNFEEPGIYESQRENCTVEHRGAMMGKVYVYHKQGVVTGRDDVEAVLLWTGVYPRGKVTLTGPITPTREAIDRAVRALAESPWGFKCLGYKAASNFGPPTTPPVLLGHAPE